MLERATTNRATTNSALTNNATTSSADRGLRNRTGLGRRTAALLAVVGLVLSACGDDDASSSDGAPPTSSPTTPTAPSSTAPPTAPPTTTAPAPVPERDLAAAKAAVLDFVDGLGAGDLARARAALGPLSVANAEAAGGVDSLLRESTEGHGAWVGATDRTVTAFGVAERLVVVVLEGTLAVEGMTEHRVAAFPVHTAGPEPQWFVEPWGHPVAADAPLAVTAPAVGPDDHAPGPGDASAALPVRMRSAQAGTVHAAFAGAPITSVEVEAGGDAAFTAPAGTTLVAVVLDARSASSPVLDAVAFAVRPSAASDPSSIDVPFLPATTNATLRACASGDPAACDDAQVPGVLDDGAFSFFHVRCDDGDDAYCILFDNLVAAELRMHGRSSTTVP